MTNKMNARTKRNHVGCDIRKYDIGGRERIAITGLGEIMTVIYEARDTTNDEIYYPVGVWLDREEAVSEIEAIMNPRDFESPGSYDLDYVKVIIVERKTGLTSDYGSIVRTFEWIKEFDYDDGENFWRRLNS